MKRKVNEKTVTLNIPSGLYAILEELAAESNTTPNDQIVTIIEEALKRKAWLRDLEELQKEIGQDKNLDTELDQEELIEKLRKARREIFEAEYAHLYR